MHSPNVPLGTGFVDRQYRLVPASETLLELCGLNPSDSQILLYQGFRETGVGQCPVLPAWPPAKAADQRVWEDACSQPTSLSAGRQTPPRPWLIHPPAQPSAPLRTDSVSSHEPQITLIQTNVPLWVPVSQDFITSLVQKS